MMMRWLQQKTASPRNFSFLPVKNTGSRAVEGGGSVETTTTMTLIIRDILVNPPTWFLSFRDLTLYCHVFLKSDIVIESDDPDLYYRWIKLRGGMDFVEDFVRPGTEDGLRLDVEPNYPRSLIVDRISPENVHGLIARIRGFHA